MNNINKYIIFGFALFLCVVSCRDPLDEISTIDNPHTPILIDDYTPTIENITSSVQGVVVDNNGALVEGATVMLNNQTVVTNPFGTFTFENTTMNKVGTFVQVEKDGYFKTGRRFYPQENETSFIRIELLEKNFSSSFESTNGGTIDIEGNGGSIVFSPNSIQDASGNIYNGTVYVATKWLDPTALNTYDQMPGALEGVNRLNEEVGLATYGMVGVELQGSNGEPLNITDGSTAELKMNVPSDLQSAAPNEIPLWSFNYTYGIWVEEGSALLQNGQYVGDVSHFSFWNCDVFSEVIEFNLQVVAETTGIPLSSILVTALSWNIGAGNSGSGYTNSDGMLSGLFPANEEILLTIHDPCGNVILSQNIGPFTTNASLGVIEVPLATQHVTGEIINCENEPVTSGIIIVKSGDHYSNIFVDSNPFEINIPVCSNGGDIELIAGDITTLEQGDPVLLPTGSSVDIGLLVACGDDLLGFYKLTIDGTTRLFEINPNVTEIGTGFYHCQILGPSILTATDSLVITLGYNNVVLGPGDFTDSHFIDALIDTENNWKFFDEFDEFIIEEIGLSGSIISGRMSGMLTNVYNGGSTEVYAEATFKAIVN